MALELPFERLSPMFWVIAFWDGQDGSLLDVTWKERNFLL
jgi:hypothetical protein